MFGRKRSDEDLIYADPTAGKKHQKPKRRGLWFTVTAVIAVALLLMAVAALGFTIQGKGQRYQDALRLLDEKDYEAAAAQLEELGDFRDSADLLTALEADGRSYAAALELMGQQRYEEAIAAFEALGDFADARKMIDHCWAAWANRLLAEGDAEAAEACLEHLSKEAYQEFMESIR